MSELTAASGVLDMRNYSSWCSILRLMWCSSLTEGSVSQSVSYTSSNSITWDMLEMRILTRHHRLLNQQSLWEWDLQAVI